MAQNLPIQIQSQTLKYHNACQMTQDLAKKARIMIQIMIVVVDKGAIEVQESKAGAKSKEQPLIH